MEGSRIGPEDLARSIEAAATEARSAAWAERLARARLAVTLGGDPSPTPEQRSLSRAYEEGPVRAARSGYHEALGEPTGTFSLVRDWEAEP